jgi:hypothetical protein
MPRSHPHDRAAHDAEREPLGQPLEIGRQPPTALGGHLDVDDVWMWAKPWGFSHGSFRAIVRWIDRKER